MSSHLKGSLLWSSVAWLAFALLQVYGIRRQGLGWPVIRDEAPYWLWLFPIFFLGIWASTGGMRKRLRKGGVEAGLGLAARIEGSVPRESVQPRVSAAAGAGVAIAHEIEDLEPLERLPGARHSVPSLLYVLAVLASAGAGVLTLVAIGEEHIRENTPLMLGGFLAGTAVSLTLFVWLIGRWARRRYDVPEAAEPKTTRPDMQRAALTRRATTILPGPPFKLDRRFARGRLRLAALPTLFGLASLAGFGVVTADEARSILRDADAWRRGETALLANANWQEDFTQLVFRRIKRTVSYVARDGTAHTGRVEYETLFGFIDGPAVVRYLPSDPSRFALSWGESLAFNRWAFVAAMAGFGLAFGGLCFWMSRNVVRELLVARACRERASEVSLQVAAAKPEGAIPMRYTLRGRSPWGPELEATFDEWPDLGGPIFLDEQRTKVLALVSPDMPDRALVVRETLLPFAFDAAQVEQVRKRL